ncbi:MAG: low temperature requirement protein A [Actinomycetota bacterium]
MPLTKWQPPGLRHEVAEDGRVTWLELFFDLVYVAALIQLGDRLSSDISWAGTAAFVGAFVVLWWTWTGATAFINRYAVDDVVHRLLTFVQMFAVGNIAVLAATTPENWQRWLPVAYLGSRIPLLIMYLRARSRVPQARDQIDHFLRFFGAATVLWAASVVVPGRAAIVVWAVALGIEFIAPVLGVRRPSDPRNNTPEIRAAYAEHFQERYALFTIIVLGETFVKTLTEVSVIGLSPTTHLFAGLGFLILFALWWTYFDDVADAHIRSTSVLSSRPPTNNLIWVYTHLPLALSITAFGVAAKKIVGVEAVADDFKDNYTLLLAGALIVILLSVAVLDLVTVSTHFAIEAPERVGPRVVAAVLIAPVAALLITGTITALVGIGLIAAIVVGQIGVEVVAAQKSEYRLTREVESQISDLAGTCEHLEAAKARDEIPPAICPHCVEHGVDPVQLRMCLTCGHVGCCDDSVGAHATEHFQETGHPVMISIEAGATWAYCYEHEVTDPDWSMTHS